MRRVLIALLFLGYTATLAVSAGHLAEWYALTLGNLPSFLALALAFTLELNAFLLSILSNSALKGSRWAAGGALVALGLVWLGNYRSMQRAGPEVEPLEVFAMSLFIPVGTYVIGKVVGELLELEARGVEEARGRSRDEPAAATNVLEDRLLQVLRGPMSLKEIYQALPEARDRLPEVLRRLEARGLVRNERGLWLRVTVPAELTAEQRSA